jgi:ferrous iron transport protein A
MPARMSKLLQPNPKNIAQLAINERAIVDHFADETLSAQLLEIGLMPGQEVKLLRRGPLGSPLYLKAGKNYLAIRAKEAGKVWLLPNN